MNYLYNKKIYLSNFVKNRLSTQFDKSDNLNDIITTNLEDHIRQLRKNLRSTLRRNSINSNMVQSIITIINEFSYKILELEYYVINQKMIKDYYRLMLNNIIGDPLLREVFKKDFMDLNNLKQTKYLLSKIKNLNEEFYNGWCIPFVSSSISSFSGEIDSIEFPIPQNLMLIEKFGKRLSFFSKYKSKFSFLNNKSIYYPFINEIFNNLFLISKFISVQRLSRFLA